MIVFIDTEVDPHTKKVADYGAVREDDGEHQSSGAVLHSHSKADFDAFVSECDTVCGHNIINHDLKYTTLRGNPTIVDTLFLSPLLFPKRPYHHLVKDDKLQVDELNNPVNDSMKARDLLNGEVAAWNQLSPDRQEIYYQLLYDTEQFGGFFKYINYNEGGKRSQPDWRQRRTQIDHNITPAKYNKLFGELSSRQCEIIGDKQSKYIVVAAGPGSGKTRVLVHKLASLLLLEDVKHEQLLMLTFSRAAATEFKKRLISLVGNAAHYVDIKTFHSYSFDLIGKQGSLDEAKDVVRRAAEMIENSEVEQSKIAKSVLVIDEAQDMGADDFRLVKSLSNRILKISLLLMTSRFL